MSKTIMFVHGAWVTPASWDKFTSFFEAQGYSCLAPGWPYVDKPVAELKKNIDARFAEQTIGSLVAHYARELARLPEPPVLIGHSFGGLIVQELLDAGFGRGGVAIDPGPPRWVFPTLPALKSAFPVLFTWNGWNKLHTMSFADFCASFANGLPASEQRAAYDEQIIQAPGRIYFQAALGLGNGVNFANPKRAPLLLIAGEKDLTVTPSMVRAMYRLHKKSPAPVELIEFPGHSHYLIAEPGWEQVAGAIQAWLERSMR
jgi:pimeloyl-ACP methyl ester carboxylesterase